MAFFLNVAIFYIPTRLQSKNSNKRLVHSPCGITDNSG